MNRIDSFSGEWRFLSNFWMAPITINGWRFPSNEHAYQAAKSLDVGHWIKMQNIYSPGAAKREGGKLPLRPDWEQIKLDVMREITAAKYDQHPDLKAKLLGTKGMELVEGNTWGDHFWGEFAGQGQNWLGKILMEYRDRA